MTIRSVKEMMTAARAEIGNLSPEETKRRVDEEGALIVDIREAHELEANGAIPGALHAPRSLIEFMISADLPLHKPEFAEDREFIFH